MGCAAMPWDPLRLLWAVSRPGSTVALPAARQTSVGASAYPAWIIAVLVTRSRIQLFEFDYLIACMACFVDWSGGVPTAIVVLLAMWLSPG
jgi:hypothetical protein